ncbi:MULTISPECIES: hypothetical protein [unclassified Streptomyces]|uniref:hypothetical protein n=1 Tax=unclassified Streptomyces TaxID=2593676 RepID=UPI0028C4B4AE|nr:MULTISPECIES: hypothetical protein [unclassified Streptomyces]WNO70382.1 hypothetical protein RPQ07_01535 [Streptomyces sp. AM8-1-1]
MSRLGWTLEQEAGVKRYFAIGSFFTLLGIILSVVLIAMGNTGGWALLAIVVITWTAGYFFLKTTRKSQP